MISLKNYKLFFIALFSFAVMACQPQAAPVFYPLTVHTTKEGHLFQVELAKTHEEQERGLMYRKTLASDHGMLFLFDQQKEVWFWMKNTLIPLDIIYIQKGGKIVHIAKMAKPEDETALPSTAPVIAVLEIYGGEADKRHIDIGDTVETNLFNEDKQ